MIDPALYRTVVTQNYYSENTVHPELVGLHSLNSFVFCDSASRGQMFGSHFGQRPVLLHATEKGIQSGAEYQFSKSTFRVEMPADGTIYRIIERFPQNITGDPIPGSNPEKLVIYEDDNTGEMGCFTIVNHKSMHQYFGFTYTFTDAYYNIRKGASFAKGTIFCHSPAYTPYGGYKYGIEANVAFASFEGVSEDGIIISSEFIKKLAFEIFEKRKVEVGVNRYPKNIYGSPGKYKPFPDIGDKIHPSGVLCSLSKYDMDITPAKWSIYNSNKIDHIFDEKIYVRGPEGVVVDIKVVGDKDIDVIPDGVMDRFNKYQEASFNYHANIVKTYRDIVREKYHLHGDGYKVKFQPKLWRLILDSMAKTGEPLTVGKDMNQKLNLIHRKAPIDQYNIEFIIKYVIIPNLAFKVTDIHGGKGVIVQIWSPDRMPVDKDGNRADIVTDGRSITNRSNLGRSYEHYINGSRRDTSRRLRQMYQLDRDTVSMQDARNAVYSQPNLLPIVKDYLGGFYNICSQSQFETFMNLNQEDLCEWIIYTLHQGIYLLMPTNNPRDMMTMVKALEQYYPQTFSTVTYKTEEGKVEETIQKIRISSLYMLLLEKIADDGSSVASARMQHSGVLSPVTRSEKFAHPHRNSPTKTVGETENSIHACYVGRMGIAETMDRNNNPLAHRMMYGNILSSMKPTDIQVSVDRNVVPLGGSKAIQLFTHICMCMGFKPTYIPEGEAK